MTTEFRISQIVNLTTDCIYETMKKDEYMIRSVTKTSNGQIIEQHISSYTYNVLKNIISNSDHSETVVQAKFLLEDWIAEN